MEKKLISYSSKQTQKLGEMLAQELYGGPASTYGDDCSSKRGGKILALEGDLGSGKTTFTQGLLKGLKVKGPYTSPTFVVMKHYRVTHNAKRETLHDIYHIDAYRINDKDILALGWKEIISDKNNIVIVEWADRIKKLLPKKSIQIGFKWISENERKISLKG